LKCENIGQASLQCHGKQTSFLVYREQWVTICAQKTYIRGCGTGTAFDEMLQYCGSAIGRLLSPLAPPMNRLLALRILANSMIALS